MQRLRMSWVLLFGVAACSGSGAGTGGSGGSGGQGGGIDPGTALGSGDWSAAADAFDAAAAANPNDSQAAFGSVLTGLMVLPEAPFVDDLLGRCGQTPLDLSAWLFGADGLMAWERGSRAGTATVTVVPAGGASRALATGAVRTTVRADEGCSSTSGVLLRVEVDEFVGPAGEMSTLTIDARVDQAQWTNGRVLTLLADQSYAPGDAAACSYVWIEVQPANGPGSRAYTAQGTITVVNAGVAADSTVRLDLDLELGSYDLTFTKTFDVDGTVEDTVEEAFSVERSVFPFAALDVPEPPGPEAAACRDAENTVNTTMTTCTAELQAVDPGFSDWLDFDYGCDAYETVSCPNVLDYFSCIEDSVAGQDCSDPTTYQYPDFSACSYGGCAGSSGGQDLFEVVDLCGTGLNETLAFDYLDRLFGRLQTLHDRLDTVISNGNAFAFELPANAFFNPAPLTFGIVEARALRAWLGAALAGYHIAHHYHYFDGNLEEMVIGVEPDRSFDTSAVVRALNTSFLEAAETPMVLNAEKAELHAVLADLLAIVDTPSTAGPFDPTALPPAARGELRRVLNAADASLDAPEALADTPEYQIHPSAYFAAPFTRASLHAALGVAQLWSVSPSDSIDFAAGFLDELRDTFFTGPATQPPLNQCSTDATCYALDTTWECNSWRYEEAGYCASDPGTSCVDESDCTDFNCSHQYCGNRDPVLIDTDPFETVFDNGGGFPDFVRGPGGLVGTGKDLGHAFGSLRVQAPPPPP